MKGYSIYRYRSIEQVKINRCSIYLLEGTEKKPGAASKTSQLFVRQAFTLNVFAIDITDQGFRTCFIVILCLCRWKS